jgi:DNA-binding NarL/FixJ family response regulator
MSERSIRVVIADDHQVFRRGLRSLITTEGGIEVVGETDNGAHAIALVRDLLPDLVLMDLRMPRGGGLDATRVIARDHPSVNVLVLTMFDDDDSVFAALRAGARGYVLKDADDEELLRSITTVGRGGAIYSRGVAARMTRFFASLDAASPRDPVFARLTESEHRVLNEMARGLNNDAIATALGYSPKTVRNYVSIIFTKLHVADRAQAIVLARQRGLG